jgi:type IV secretion system protein VirB9
MKLHNVCSIGLIVATGLWAQTNRTNPPPVEVKRVPPAAAREGVPDPQKYPFNQLIGALSSDQAPVANLPAMPPGNDVPADFQPVKDVPLPPVAEAALKVTRSWMAENHVPAPGNDGRVVYTYGAGLATLVCAPLRVCVIELELGEKIVGEPHIGDSVRWIVSPATSGRGDREVPMLVVKPKQAGLDTTLLVTTDRRAYYLRLVSKPDDFLARIAFSYPEEETKRWHAHLAEQERRRKEEFEAAQIAPLESIENLYFDYRIVGGDATMRPVRVLDDGKKTYVQMSTNVATREAPVLVVLGQNGPEMVNYRVKGDMYIVDRLFERGALILGAGKKARKVEIIRGTYRGKVKGDPYSRYTNQRQR